jgi:hypothetical protein
MLCEDDKLLKRLELYFDDQQADLALFSAILTMTLMPGSGDRSPQHRHSPGGEGSDHDHTDRLFRRR